MNNNFPRWRRVQAVIEGRRLNAEPQIHVPRDGELSYWAHVRSFGNPNTRVLNMTKSAFRCPGCRRWRSWEHGCDDDQGEVCDACWQPDLCAQ